MIVLITGGFGYLGGRLAQFLESHTKYTILLGSRQQTTSPFWLPNAKVVQTRWKSLPNLEEVCVGVSTIVFLSGMNAQDCATDPVGALEFNTVATARLLKAAIRQRVKRFIYISTAHVYGNPLAGVITEETCPISLHPYATSHRAGEDAVRYAHQRGNIEGIVIRLSNAYGAPADKEANCWTLLVNDICRQAVTTQRMVLKTSGVQRRDFIPLAEACRAIMHLMELSSDKLGNGLFNVGGAWSPTILEMTKHVGERIYAATCNRPEIILKEDQKTKRIEILDYGIKKLIETGFNMNRNSSIDKEIDGLIQFCLNHKV